MAIVMLALDGVGDGPVGVAIDIVGTASRLLRAGLVDVPRALPTKLRIVSIDGAPVRTASGRSLAVDGACSLRGLGADDIVVVPGLGTATEAEIATALVRPDVVRGCELVARAVDKGMLVAASCAATFVLGEAGVLDGREATTTWWLAPAFARRFPRVTLRSDRIVVGSDAVYTAGSAFAHADLMLALLARTSPSLAHMVASYLVLDERASQARYIVNDHLRTADPVLRALERFVASNVDRQLTVPQMARATGTSPRTLARTLERGMGTTPQRFAQRIRIARAVHLLATTRRSVDDVAAAVGYADAAAFRRVFRRETGESPTARRARAH